MIKLHPEFLKKNGKAEFVVFPYDEYAIIQELLEDVEDLMDLREAKKKEAGKSALTLNEVKSKLKTAKPVSKKRNFR
ncbi:MAG: type II toxin-antitoxin system Phd/YefM family antitoxin [Candidatus Wallbacteria bacterium]|nr:type II toxin-antitoxin system Phd/YefM family antitoxin [Candidatus Wallbacteria bacterium]